MSDDARLGNVTERKALKFDSGPRTTLTVAYKHDSLAATVRYNDERDISEGDEIDLLTAHTGDKFGTATVERTETVEVRRALDVIHNWWAEYGITQPDTLVKRLNSYYEDVITHITEVKVIVLNLDPCSLQPGKDRSEDESDREVRTDGGTSSDGTEQTKIIQRYLLLPWPPLRWRQTLLASSLDGRGGGVLQAGRRIPSLHDIRGIRESTLLPYIGQNPQLQKQIAGNFTLNQFDSDSSDCTLQAGAEQRGETR